MHSPPKQVPSMETTPTSPLLLPGSRDPSMHLLQVKPLPCMAPWKGLRSHTLLSQACTSIPSLPEQPWPEHEDDRFPVPRHVPCTLCRSFSQHFP